MPQANWNLTQNFMGMWTTHDDFLQGNHQPILACLKELSFSNFPASSNFNRSTIAVFGASISSSIFFSALDPSGSNQTSTRRSKHSQNASPQRFWTCFGITFRDGMMLWLPLNATFFNHMHYSYLDFTLPYYEMKSAFPFRGKVMEILPKYEIDGYIFVVVWPYALHDCKKVRNRT